MCLSRIFYANWLDDQGDPKRAAEELEKAEQLVQENTGKTLDTYNIRYNLLHSMVEFSIRPPPTAEARIQRHRELVKQAASLGDRTNQRKQLRATMENAQEFRRGADSGSSHLVAHIVCREVIMEHLAFAAEAHPHPSTAASCLNELVDYQYLNSDLEWLHHLDRFFERWPEFDVPLLLAWLLDKKYTLVKMIDGNAAAALIVPECERALANTPHVRWTRNGTLEALDDYGDMVLSRLPYENNGLSSNTLYIVKILIRWIKHETSNAMPKSQAKKISVEIEEDAENGLDSVDPINVAAQIFGRDKPTEDIQWRSWFDEVLSWLTHSDISPSKFLSRHELLARICQCRMSWLTIHIAKVLIVSPKEALELQRQSRNEMELHIEICQSLQTEAVSGFARWKMKTDLMGADFRLLMHPQDEQAASRFTDGAILEFQEFYERYVTFLRSMHSREALFLVLIELARYIWVRWCAFDTVPIIEVFRALDEADELFRGVLGQGFVLQSLQAFNSQMHVADQYNASQPYENGVRYAYTALCRCFQRNKQGIKEVPGQRPPDDLNQVAITFTR